MCRWNKIIVNFFYLFFSVFRLKTTTKLEKFEKKIFVENLERETLVWRSDIQYNDTQHNDTELWVALCWVSFNADYCCADFRYADGHGAVL